MRSHRSVSGIELVRLRSRLRPCDAPSPGADGARGSRLAPGYDAVVDRPCRAIESPSSGPTRADAPVRAMLRLFVTTYVITMMYDMHLDQLAPGRSRSLDGAIGVGGLCPARAAVGGRTGYGQAFQIRRLCAIAPPQRQADGRVAFRCCRPVSRPSTNKGTTARQQRFGVRQRAAAIVILTLRKQGLSA